MEKERRFDAKKSSKADTTVKAMKPEKLRLKASNGCSLYTISISFPHKKTKKSQNVAISRLL